MTVTNTLRRAVLVIALLNLAYFVIEFTIAVVIGSVSLFADSVDFLEDTAINLLIFFALAWSVAKRARVGAFLALLIFIPGAAALVTAIMKMLNPEVPSPQALTITAAGAFLVNLTCAILIARFRGHEGSLTTAAWLSARNDTIANLVVISIGLALFVWPTAWLDIIAGLFLAALNMSSAKEIYEASRKEKVEDMFEDD